MLDTDVNHNPTTAETSEEEAMGGDAVEGGGVEENAELPPLYTNDLRTVHST